jgi:GH25 family lysozyme M1 (1,4-beta-N-acetylmuramidase)/peptidoglycan hydrolase-like protein with peptidoglycan-binding domain
MPSATEILRAFPVGPGSAREALILDLIKQGQHLELEWAELEVKRGADTATLFVTADAVRIGDLTDAVRINATARTAQQIADLLGCVLQTPKICDLVWEQASIKLSPSFQAPDAAMASTERMVLHSRAVDEKIRGRVGLVANVGKDWVLTNRLFSHPQRAANYGWFDTRAPNRRMWQTLGLSHNLEHVDYSQVVRLVRRDAKLNGQNVAIDSAEISWALSSEGPLKAFRIPNVPELPTSQAPQTPRPSVVRSLRRGMSGEDVKNFQKSLVALGYDFKPWGPDGEFGRITEDRTRAFQLESGLTPDGVAGPDTLKALDARIKAGNTGTVPPTITDEQDTLGKRAIDWCRREMARENPPSAKTKALWFAHAERNGKKLGVTSGNHCAITQSVAALESTSDPALIPHRARAGAKELQRDAMAVGAFHSVADVRAGKYKLRPGDLAIYDRSQPARPETGWWGHVDRVTRVFEKSYENIGANAGPNGEWRVQTTDFNHPKLLGFIAYPQALAKPVAVPSDEARAADVSVAPLDEPVAEAPIEAEYILGVDVSHHNGAIDWQAIKAFGFKYAFCKATEGTNFKDPRFDENWRGMREAGLLRSAYHFANPLLDPLAQARFFREVVGPLQKGDLPPVLDLEKVTSRTPSETVEFALACLRHMEELFGVRPIFYTYPGYWGTALGKTDRLKDYPLWEAHYTSGMSPLAMVPWKHWTFWQYTNQGRVTGIPQALDVNRFQGGEDALALLANLGTEAPTVEPDAGTGDPAVDVGSNDAIEIELPTLDLGKSQLFGGAVPILQALLLAKGYGPEGLADVRGLPDGHAGPRTAEYVRHFRNQLKLGDEPVVDIVVWRALLRP